MSVTLLLTAMAAAQSSENNFSVLHSSINRSMEQTLIRVNEQVAKTGFDKAEAEPTISTAPANVEGFARRFWGGKVGAAHAAIGRVNTLRPLLVPILKEEGVPESLLAVVLIESGGRPTAISPKGAAGLWQFMPATARDYGLAIQGHRDERFSLERSTRAAARHLRSLYSSLGSWELALAAYNFGEAALRTRMRKSGGRTFSETSSALPLETARYVPAVLEAGRILNLPYLD